MQIFLVQELIGLLLEVNTKAVIHILRYCIGRSRVGLFLLNCKVVRNLLDSVFICHASKPSLDIYNKRKFEKKNISLATSSQQISGKNFESKL